jgi:transposase
MSRDDLLVVVDHQAGQLAEQAGQLAARDRQIAGMARQLSELVEANEALAGKLARLEHLLSRNSGNSSSPPSQDDGPGKPAPPEKKPRRGSGPARARGKQPGAPGAHLAWTDNPNERRDRFPTGRCDCGADLAAAADLGVVDRYQQHEIPQVRVTITQYEQHRVGCGCGKIHTAGRPEGARSGPVGYGPNLQAFAVYLMVVQFVPAHRVLALLESLTGTAPSVGFVHGLLARTAGLLGVVHDRIRALITLAYAVSVDETPLKVGPRTPKPGRKKADKYLLVACTELYTHYLLGDRDLETFSAFVLTERAQNGGIIVHDRYQNYDCDKFAGVLHQLCCAHLLRDLADAAQVYPDEVWPSQIARALRELIHHANLARDTGRDHIDPQVLATLIDRFKHGVRAGLSDTLSRGTRPGENKVRLLLEALRDREGDVLLIANLREEDRDAAV